MRDCLFLVADEAIAAMLRGFLGRDQWHLSLGCGAFTFDGRTDILVDATRDPGVYTRGHALLAPYATSYRHAVVILDADWSGSPGAGAIARKIESDLQTHWASYLVIVLDPELEAWIWQDNVHVATALGAESYNALRHELEALGLWADGQPKPHRPKEAVEHALQKNQIPRSNAIYQRIASRVSIRNCADPALAVLRNNLADWFPA